MTGCLNTGESSHSEGISPSSGVELPPAPTGASGGPAPEIVGEEIKELPFEEAGIGFTGPPKKEYLAFYTPGEMAPHIGQKDLFREIDFTREMVLACFMGEQSSGGYMCRITSLEEGDESITAYVELTEPAPGDLVAQMLTSPWSAVAVKRSEKKIQWIEVRAER